MWFVRRQSVHSGIAELLRELIYFFAVWAVGALIAHLLGVDVTIVAAWWGLVLATGCSLRINFAVRNIEAIIAAQNIRIVDLELERDLGRAGRGHLVRSTMSPDDSEIDITHANSGGGHGIH
jgi:hypothetical protein